MFGDRCIDMPLDKVPNTLSIASGFIPDAIITPVIFAV
jgi:hypothetical protein